MLTLTKMTATHTLSMRALLHKIQQSLLVNFERVVMHRMCGLILNLICAIKPSFSKEYS